MKTLLLIVLLLSVGQVWGQTQVPFPRDFLPSIPLTKSPALPKRQRDTVAQSLILVGHRISAYLEINLDSAIALRAKMHDSYPDMMVISGVDSIIFSFDDFKKWLRKR